MEMGDRTMRKITYYLFISLFVVFLIATVIISFDKEAIYALDNTYLIFSNWKSTFFLSSGFVFVMYVFVLLGCDLTEEE